MILDQHLILSDDQGAITASAATTNEIDFGSAPTNPDSDPIGFVVFHVGTAMGGAGSIVLKVQDSADGTTYADIALSKSLLAADLPAGAEVKVPVPGNHRRYIQGYYDVTGVITDLKCTAYLATN